MTDCYYCGRPTSGEDDPVHLECREPDTTWGQDIDSFVLHNFLKDDRKLATIQINRIILKALQSQLHELMEKFSPSSK